MITYRVTDETGIHLNAQQSGILNQDLMHDIGNTVRATTALLTSQGKDYRGKAFPRYSTKRIYVPLSHKPRPRGGRRIRLSALGKGGEASYVTADVVGKRKSEFRKGLKRGSRKKGTALKTVAYDRGYLQFRAAMGRSTRPDLQFTGKMLSAFQIVKLTHSRVKLGFVSTQERNKAIGNITGMRGRSGRKRNPRRFIGIGRQHTKSIETIMEVHLDKFATGPEPRRVRRID